MDEKKFLLLFYSTQKNCTDGHIYSTQAQTASSSFESVLSVYCLAALDLGAGVEQPIDCLIIQNRQSVVVPAPQPEPASRLKSATRDVNFLRSDLRCRRYLRALSSTTQRYVGSEQKGRVPLLWLTFSPCLASLLLRWKTANTAFVVLSFNFQVLRYSLTLAMSLFSTFPLFVSLHQHALLLRGWRMVCILPETVVGWSEMYNMCYEK